MTRIGRTGLMLLIVGAGALLPERLRAQEQDAAGARDYGVGILSFAFSPAPGVDLPAADTLVIHQHASAHSPVVARFLFEAQAAFAWSYALEANEAGVQSNALEFGYEVQGLPFDTVASGGQWVRVIYGTSARGIHRRGWVRAAAGRTRHRFWAEELAEHFLFVSRPEGRVAFYDRPDGEPVRVELVRGGKGGERTFDYRLEPLAVEGRWMRVRVVTPNVPCSTARVEPRKRIAWIEYLDERGRPRVWYHTRGC